MKITISVVRDANDIFIFGGDWRSLIPAMLVCLEFKKERGVMSDIRSSVFANMGWYPVDSKECLKLIREWSATPVEVNSRDIKHLGGIVPHAGWYFSGEIAAAVFSCLSGTMPELIVLFGKHLSPLSPHSIMIDGFWETPLGNIKIDSRIGAILADEYDFVVETASSFEKDNTIELQLPFIKHFFPEASLLPIGAPPTMKSLDIARRVGELCRRMDIQAVAIGSTDLTHYGPNYGFMPAGTGKEAVNWVVNNDKRVIERICAMDAIGVMEEAAAHRNACCAGACASAVVMAGELGAHMGESIMYATSYDKSPGSSFVGYVGAVF